MTIHSKNRRYSLIVFTLAFAIFAMAQSVVLARASVTPRELRFENGTGFDSGTIGTPATAGITFKTRVMLSDGSILDEFATSSSAIVDTETYLDSFVGSIAFHGVKPPSDLNWIPCDGRTLLKSQYPKLYSAIGDVWSVAENGNVVPPTPATHFRVPDLRGRFLVGVLEDDTLDVLNPSTGISSGQAMAPGQVYEDKLALHTHNYGNTSATRHRVTLNNYTYTHSHTYRQFNWDGLTVFANQNLAQIPPWNAGPGSPHLNQTTDSTTLTHDASDHNFNPSVSISDSDQNEDEVRPINYSLYFYIFAGYPNL